MNKEIRAQKNYISFFMFVLTRQRRSTLYQYIYIYIYKCFELLKFKFNYWFIPYDSFTYLANKMSMKFCWHGYYGLAIFKFYITVWGCRFLWNRKDGNHLPFRFFGTDIQLPYFSRYLLWERHGSILRLAQWDWFRMKVGNSVWMIYWVCVWVIYWACEWVTEWLFLRVTDWMCEWVTDWACDWVTDWACEWVTADWAL